jgi:hypothetical protein
MPSRTSCLLAVSVLLSGCGYIGEPLPPALNIPARVTDLRAIERGDKLVIQFTIPALTTDGMVLARLGPVELRVGPAGAAPFEIDRWASQAKLLETGATQPGAVQLQVPAQEWVGREVILAVRVSNRKGRVGEWSNLVALPVVPPLARPAAPKAEATSAGVLLSWQAPPGLAFRVYRNAELLAEAQSPEYLDTTAQYGQSYKYSVQSVLKEAESEISEAVEITPQDRFPPAVPTGLTAIAAAQSIELSWDRNREPDLKGYYLYRADEGGPFSRIGDLLVTPSASDRSVESGKRYRYAVSAVDQLDNESAPCAPVEVTAP